MYSYFFSTRAPIQRYDSVSVNTAGDLRSLSRRVWQPQTESQFFFLRAHFWPRKTNGRLKGYKGWSNFIFWRFFFLPVVPLVAEEWARSVDSCLSFSPFSSSWLLFSSRVSIIQFICLEERLWMLGQVHGLDCPPNKTPNQHKSHPATLLFFFLIRHESVFEQIICSSSLLPFPPSLSPVHSQRKAGTKINKGPCSFAWADVRDRFGLPSVDRGELAVCWLSSPSPRECVCMCVCESARVWVCVWDCTPLTS